MIDYHCHLLPSVDDGPTSMEESLVMARSLHAFGFRDIYCTPHCIRGFYDCTPELVRDQVESLQRQVVGAGISVRLHAGMEYSLDDCFPAYIDNLLPLGSTHVVLCEAPLRFPLEHVREMLKLIVRKGFVPLVAHPERNPELGRMLQVCQELPPEGDGAERSFGCGVRAFTKKTFHAFSVKPVAFPEEALFQANLGSFSGFYGKKVQKLAEKLLKQGRYACVASDLHDSKSIPTVLHAGREDVEIDDDLRPLLAFKPPTDLAG